MAPLGRLQPHSVRVRHISRGSGTEDGAVSVLGEWFFPNDITGVNGIAGFQSGEYNRVKGEEGSFSLRFPNAAGGDGTLHRERFAIITQKETYRVGDEWLEVWQTHGDRPGGKLLFVGSPAQAKLTPRDITISGPCVLFMQRHTRETSIGFWTAAPRDVFEHYTKAISVEIVDDFTDESRFTWATGHTETLDELWGYSRVSNGDDAATLRPDSPASDAQAYVYAMSAINPTGRGSTDDLETLRVSARFQADGIPAVDTSWVQLDCLTSGTLIGIRLLGTGKIRMWHEASDDWVSVGQLQAGVSPNGAHELTIELRDRWLYGFVDGVLMGDPLPTPDQTGETGGGSWGVATVGKTHVVHLTSFTAEKTVPFLLRGADKGDLVLPVSPEPGGLQAAYFHDEAKIAKITASNVDVDRPEFLLAPTMTEVVRREELAPMANHDTVRTPANAGLHPAQIDPTKNMSARWTGSIYLDLANRDYEFETYADDGIRLWVGRLRFGDQLVDEWPASSVGARVMSGKLKATHGFPAVSGWYPLMIESYTSSGGWSMEVLLHTVSRGGAQSLATRLGEWSYPELIADQCSGVDAWMWGTRSRDSTTVIRERLKQKYDNTVDHHLTMSGGSTIDVLGEPFQGCRPITFTDLYATATGPTAITAALDESWSMSGWVRIDGGGVDYRWLSFNDGIASTPTNVFDVNLRASAATNQWGVWRRRSGAQTFYTADAVLTVGAWYHLAIVFDNIAGTLSFYTNGVLTETHSGLTASDWDIGARIAAAPAVYIGRPSWSGAGIPDLTGKVAYPLICAKKLTAAEIQAQVAVAAADPGLGHKLSPVGTVREHVRFDSAHAQLEGLGEAFGIEYVTEPRHLESGEFPGQVIPRRRIGRTTSYIVDELEGADVENTITAQDAVDKITFDAQGIADADGAAQLTYAALSADDMRRAWVLQQEYESLSDISIEPMLKARAEALLTLRRSPIEEVGVRPEGKSELTDAFPITGSLAELEWEPGDAVFLRQRNVGIDDLTPRQMNAVSWTFTPHGRSRPSVTWRQRPRGLPELLRRMIRQSTNKGRNYQGQLVAMQGTMGSTTGTGGVDTYSRMTLPADLASIVGLYLDVPYLTNAGWTIELNGVNTSIAVNAPGVYPLAGFWQAVVSSTALHAYARLLSGTGSHQCQLRAIVRV